MKICLVLKNVNKFQDEIWKEIEGFEGEYAISSKGRVRNLENGRLLGGHYNNTGYRLVKLKGKWHTVHRLVALAFIPNPQKLPQVNHIDEDKLNNDVKNLEWCSAAYNINYSIHKRYCKVKQLDKCGNLIIIWNSIRQIEKETGYDSSYIVKCCKGKRRYAYGFQWQYLDSNSQRVVNRPVAVYKKTEFIGVFANARKAAEVLGLCHMSVFKCLKGRSKSTHGFSFKYK